MLGLYEVETKGEGGKILNQEETVAGETELSNQFEEYRFPLEGKAVGVDRGTSWLLTGTLYVLDQYAGGIVGAPEPTGDRCSVTDLLNGQMSAKLEVLEQDQLRVTLEPISGHYTVTCGGEPIDGPVGVWNAVRMLKGMGDDEPFVFTFANGQRVSNIYSNFQGLEELGGKLLSDGTLRITDSQLRMHSLMVVSLYESLKELQEERRKATQTPTPRAS